MAPQKKLANRLDWHAPSCPLYEIAPHDCAYNRMKCDCGWSGPDDEATFCAQFKAHMLRIVGRETFDDGTSIADYADMTAPTYFEQQHQDGESPEDCADADVSYWED